MAGGNDFYLNFGSNADPFAKDLASELGPGIRQITALTEAIIKYDETVGDLSSSNPLGGLFSNLDNVSAKLESIGKDLSGTFGRITDSLGVLTRDLQTALSAVDRASSATTRSNRKQSAAAGGDGEEISYQEALRRAQQNEKNRAKATQAAQTSSGRVSDDELSPAKQRKTQSTISKATSDADAARNAVKRVADINATLARNATESADALKNLGQSIRTLTVQTRTTDKGVTEGRFQQNVIQVQGGAVAGGGAQQVLASLDESAINRLLASAGIQAPAQAPVRDEAHAAQRQAQAERDEERRNTRTLTPERFSEPAAPGRYEVPGERGARTVSRVIPGETFEDYFGRVAQNAQGLNQVRTDVQSASENRVGIQQSRELQKVQQLIGRRGLEKLSGDETLRNLDRGNVDPVTGVRSGNIMSEQVRASINASLEPGQTLTPEQYRQVPDAVAEFQKMQEDFAKFSRGDVARRIGANPLETFSFPREKDRKDVFGTQRDYREQVTNYDEEHEPEGAGFRARTEAEIREAMQAKSDRTGAYRDFQRRQEPGVDRDGVPYQYNPVAEGGSTYRTPHNVIGDRGDLDRPTESVSPHAEYDAFVEQAKAEAAAQRRAGEVAQQYPEGALPIAQGDAQEVKARLDEAAQNLSESNEATVEMTRAERKYAQALLQFVEALEARDTNAPGADGKLGRAEQNLDARQERVAPARREELQDLADRDPEALRAQIAGAGGRPPTPPRPPAPPAAAGGEEPEDSAYARQLRAEAQEQARERARINAAGSIESDQARPGAGASEVNARPRVAGTPFEMTENIQAFEASLKQATRDIISQAREDVPKQIGLARQNTIERAGTALRNDPAFAELNSVSKQRATLGTLLQLPRSGATNNALAQVYGRGDSGSASLGAVSGEEAEKNAAASREEADAKARATAQYQRYERALQSVAGSSEAVQRATLAEFVAQERRDEILNKSTVDTLKLAAAERDLIAAQGATRSAQANENPSVQSQLFGNKGFGASQLRHIGTGLENTIGYTLVFEGLDKLKELVHDGLEAQAAFARLQASLNANGIAAGNLRQDFQNISAETATPLEQVTEAASELSGTLQSTGDIAFGAKVSAQLANISQGTLTAKDAAVALRDVVAAYGDQWEQTGISVHQGIQQAGDDIAHLSQLTGVNVKDIAEGTSEVASEARDFGLNQRQASTIAAYVTQGTGQTGEQAASQTTRLISGLYNTKTQEALQRVLKPTAGGPSVQQEFANGNIGGVLTQLIQQYGSLNDSSKQYIANLVGTGITARAFAALIGGGSNAVKALNGNYSDFGALNQQNQSYLQTISGRIKQLDEDFQNFGSTLQRLGAFDFLGGLAEALDFVFQKANEVFGFFANQAGKNYFGLPTEQALHLGTTLLEAAAAYKLFGGIAVRGALGTGLGSRLIGGVGAVNQAEIDAATAAGSSEIPKARYRASAVSRQFGINAQNRFRRQAEDGAASEEQTGVRTVEERQIQATTTSLVSMNRGVLATTEALGALTETLGATAVAEEGAAATAQAASAAQLGAAESSVIAGAGGQLLLPGTAGLAAREGEQLALFGGGAGSLSSEARVAEQAAAGEGQLGLPLLFRNPTNGRIASHATAAERDLTGQSAARQGSLFTEEELATAKAGGGLPNVIPAGLGAGAVPVAETDAAVAARVGKLGVLGRSLGLGGAIEGASAVPGIGGALGGALASPLLGTAGAIGVGLYAYSQLSAAQGDAKSRNTAEDQILAGSTDQATLNRTKSPTGAAGFRDYYLDQGPFGSSIPGEIGNGIVHTGRAALNLVNPVNGVRAVGDVFHGNFGSAIREFGGGSGHQGPSSKSLDQETALATRGYNEDIANLPGLSTAGDIQKFTEGQIKEIEKQRKDIQSAGGNNKQAQAQVAFSINQLEANLKQNAQNRLRAIQGLSAIDALNSQQVDDLQTALGSVSQLNVNTLTTQSGAVQALLNSGTLTPGSKAYKDLQAAAGITGPNTTAPKANVVGYNEQHQYGYYAADGTFYSSLNPTTHTAGPAPGQTAPDIRNPLNVQSSSDLFRNSKGVIGNYNDQGQFQAAGASTLDRLSPSDIQSIDNRPTPTSPRNAKTESTAARLQALSGGYEQSIKNATAILQSAGKPGGATNAAIEKAQQQLQTGLTGYQQVQDQIYQSPIQAAQARVSFATSFGGSAGAAAGLGLPTGTGAAVTATNQEVTALQKYGTTLAKDSPEYFQNLQAIATAKQSIAQILAAPELANLAVQSASTSDAVTKAGLQYQSAQVTLGADERGGASVQQIGQDRAAVAAAGIAGQQASQAVRANQYQLQITQHRNSVSKAQIQLTAALQAESVYRQGGLADQSALLTAEGQEVQARQAIADAIEAQKEGAIEARAALAKYRGDDVAAATDELAKAQAAYAYAVKEYGRKSVEAQQAYASVITARTDVNSAVTTQIESGLDLEIAQLNARGQSGDAQRAANVSLQKAQVALSRYLKEGGKKGTSTYNQLYGQVITAQRTAFDTGLQAQLDTLDFQQQTYQITGAQEIASLQQILKNKQLTLAEQRSITLKIKSLQDNIREELTSGGLNIPSDIKLPTAYDVRRSLGAGFTGSQTSANVVNNNQTASVTVYQTLPNKAVAQAVAAEVVNLINQQTGSQVRANSATPRNVAVGGRT